MPLRNPIRHTILLMAFGLLLAAPALARTPDKLTATATEDAPLRLFTIAGEIVDEHANPAPGVTVTILAHGGSAVTDDLGRYIIDTRIPIDAESISIVASVPDDRTGQRITTQTVAIEHDAPFLDAGTLTMRTDECEPEWVQGISEYSGLNSSVYALMVFDDGAGDGAALYAGGAFTVAVGMTANFIARWDGSSWTTLGTGTNNTVHALTVFDDGSGNGPALYAGGEFTSAGGNTANRIARWDGTSWTPLGSGMDSAVYALTVFDDGSGNGPALYAGGAFTSAGGNTANHIARWDGTSWTPLDSGMNDTVYALAVFDDGSRGGPVLYVGGNFTSAGTSSAFRIARWDGNVWVPMGSGVSNLITNTPSAVYALTVFDDGSGYGPALYVGGDFIRAGSSLANRIAKWDGSSWSPLGSGVSRPSGTPTVRTLTVFDDGAGNGPALYAGGDFTSAGGNTASRIARWDGASWSPLASGVSSRTTDTVRALTVFDDGAGDGSALYVGGWFITAGDSAADSIARWNAESWSLLDTGVIGVNNSVWTLTVFDDGSGGGPAVYAGGWFTTAGESLANRIARWDGSAWSPLGSGMNNWVMSLTTFDDGSGSGLALYAGGQFTTAGGQNIGRIARWDGSAWSALGSGVGSGFTNTVLALTVFDDGSGDGPALYAGGQFTAAGENQANRIARWDGSSWSPLGSGLGSVPSDAVLALTIFDDGSGNGPALYAGGQFTTAGAVEANNIAHWDGSSWSPLGSGINGLVYALAVFDDGSGSGPALYAGGQFTTAGGDEVNNIARWDGTSWSPLSSGSDGVVYALEVFDDGTGNGLALYAGGQFTTVGEQAISRIARWNGTSWSPLGSGTNNGVLALTVFDDGSESGSALYAGGAFNVAGGVVSRCVAKWQPCPDITPAPCPGDINSDGTVGLDDFAILAANFGTGPGATLAQGDLNADGFVNLADFNILATNFGSDCN